MRTVLVALVLGAVLLVVVPASQAVQSCGTFTGSSGAPIAVRVLAGPTSCTTAKGVLRRYFRRATPRTCTSSACPRTVRGWKCSSATSGASPRLGECAKASARVAAYSTAD